jgi:uncharacterized iron-regulated membrane protein
MRAFATAVHRWAGLAVALFLIVSGLTGAVISWDHEIDGWLNRKLYDTPARGPFKDPFELAAAVEQHDPRARVAYLPLGFEEGHAAGYFVQPRTDPATGKPYKLGYNQVFVDPVTAEVRGRRDASAVSLKPETLMPFLRKLHYMLHVPAMWGSDRVGWWIMGTVALVWLLDSFVALYLTMPRRLRKAVQPGTPPPAVWWQRWKPAWTVRWAAGGYKLNFDLHRAGGLWIWLLIIVIAFTSFSLNLYKEVFYPGAVAGFEDHAGPLGAGAARAAGHAHRAHHRLSRDRGAGRCRGAAPRLDHAAGRRVLQRARRLLQRVFLRPRHARRQRRHGPVEPLRRRARRPPHRQQPAVARHRGRRVLAAAAAAARRAHPRPAGAHPDVGDGADGGDAVGHRHRHLGAQAALARAAASVSARPARPLSCR